MKVILKDVRIAFPNIWEPKQYNGQGEPACSAAFVMTPDHPALAEVKKTIILVAQELWKDKAANMIAALKAKDDICLHDGNVKADYEGFAGNFFVSARNKARPRVIGASRDPATGKPVELKRADGKPYAGCYVNAAIDIWAQDNGWGKRINAKLLAVQFWRDGEPFSGGAQSEDSDFNYVDGDGAAAGSGLDDIFGSMGGGAATSDPFQF